ncbi:MAG: pilus assembly protein PilM [Candidatus Omnitrophota bacterium]
MLRLKPEYFPTAIEIGSSSLKLLQLAKFKSSYKILKADYASLGRDKGVPVSIIPEDSLEKLVKENRVKGEVAVSIPLSGINTYSYTLPDMPAGEVEPALTWKIKQNLPPGVKFDDISFDYVCASPQEAGNKDIYVLVFVTSKKTVLDMAKFFKGLSLDLVSIEPQPYAVIEALSLSKNISEKETVLVLRIGASNSSIIIVSGGHPYLITPLGASGNGFTGILAGYYQFDWEKAEALKIEEGLGECPALSSQMENMLIDIEHAIKDFSHKFVKSKAPEIERLILCGGAAALKNLDKFLADKLEIPVNVFDPLAFFVSHSENGLNPVVQQNSIAFTGALGLATKFINGGIDFEIKAG